MGQIEQQAVVGASELTLPIAHANPYPPDVATGSLVPAGGQLYPCTPRDGSQTARRTQYLLQFAAPEGFQLAIRRLHLHLPVFLQEETLIKDELKNEETTRYHTEEEARQAREGVGGLPIAKVEQTPIGFERAYEEILTNYALNANSAGENVLTETVKTARSVLPITMQVVAAIIGPDGTIWADSFEVPMRYQQTSTGAPGKAVGTGLIDSYTDLQNPLIINPRQVYGYALFVRIPTTVPVIAALGRELNAIEGTTGEAIFFYDIEPTPIGK